MSGRQWAPEWAPAHQAAAAGSALRGWGRGPVGSPRPGRRAQLGASWHAQAGGLEWAMPDDLEATLLAQLRLDAIRR